MSLRDSAFGELKVPLTWTAAVAVVVAAIVAIVLLATDRRGEIQAEAYGATRKMGDAIAAPVGGVLAAPIRWTGAGIDEVRGYFFAISENRRLKAELREARQWRDVALAMRDTNDRYRALLGLKTDPPIPMIAARVVSEAHGPFANTRLANAGDEKGVKPGYPVMSENGLVGRVIGVTTGVSRVLLLTDIASRVPVMIDRTNARAILAGDGGPNPRLDYMRGQDPVRAGDRVVTSGDGGVMPRGLPVGVAAKGLDGHWRVVLASDAAPIDFVRILLFQDFSQLANLEDLNKMPVPPPSGVGALGVTSAQAQPGAGGPATAAAAAPAKVAPPPAAAAPGPARAAAPSVMAKPAPPSAPAAKPAATPAPLAASPKPGTPTPATPRPATPKPPAAAAASTNSPTPAKPAAAKPTPPVHSPAPKPAAEATAP